jgi:3-hydroxybutyryl-CoA dehydratase
MHKADGDIMAQDGYTFDEMRIGMSESMSRIVTEADISDFARVSGDTNPVHLDEEYAKATMFGGCVAHGLLTASIISAVLGTKLPGPGCVYISQTLTFLGPVRVGDCVTATVTVTELMPEKKRVRLATSCHVGDRLVIDGEALLRVYARAPR